VLDVDDLLAFLERCKDGLHADGMLIIKENVCEKGFVVDPVRTSSSATGWSPFPRFLSFSRLYLCLDPIGKQMYMSGLFLQNTTGKFAIYLWAILPCRDCWQCLCMVFKIQ